MSYLLNILKNCFVHKFFFVSEPVFKWLCDLKSVGYKQNKNKSLIQEELGSKQKTH